MNFLLLFLILAHADQKAIVWSRHPEAIRKYFPENEFFMLDGNAEQQALDESGFINLKRRDGIFRKLELENALKNFADMDTQ